MQVIILRKNILEKNIYKVIQNEMSNFCIEADLKFGL